MTHDATFGLTGQSWWCSCGEHGIVPGGTPEITRAAWEEHVARAEYAARVGAKIARFAPPFGQPADALRAFHDAHPPGGMDHGPGGVR